MIAELPYILLIISIVLVSLWVSNILYDLKVPHYISRKVSHAGAGVAMLLCVFLLSSGWWAFALACGFSLALALARVWKPDVFRGVGGSGRQHAFAEVFLPASAAVAIAVGWLWLNNPWLAVVPVLFVAWGDCITGIVRSQVYKREVKGNWGSVAMLGACLLIAFLFKPFWIGAVGAVVGTLAEKYTPLSRAGWDDNHTIVLSSLTTMALLAFFTGNL